MYVLIILQELQNMQKKKKRKKIKLFLISIILNNKLELITNYIEFSTYLFYTWKVFLPS